MSITSRMQATNRGVLSPLNNCCLSEGDNKDVVQTTPTNVFHVAEDSCWVLDMIGTC